MLVPFSSQWFMEPYTIITMIISYFLSSLLVSSSITTARVVEYNWEVSYRTLSPNGIPKRMAVVNGQFPGPTMRASVGDTVRVNLHNNLGDNGTSIHFHGINQLGTVSPKFRLSYKS